MPVLVVAGFLAVFIGMAVGLLGGGGSILTTPLLVYLLGFEPKQAIAASLFVVAITSGFALIQHARAKRVNWRIGLIFGAAGMVGAFVGGQVGSRLPAAILLGAFAVMMGVTAVAMVRGRRQVQVVAHAGSGLPLFRILLDGFVVGLVTGLVGAGGGFLVVPALVLLGGLPMQMAVGTSLLVVMMKSIAGLLGYLVHFGGPTGVTVNIPSDLNWVVLLVVTVAPVIGSFLGAGLSGRIHPDRLRRGFGYFVLAMAFFILSQQIGGSILEFARATPLQAVETVVGGLVVAALIVLAIRWPAKMEVAAFDAADLVRGLDDDTPAGARPPDDSR